MTRVLFLLALVAFVPQGAAAQSQDVVVYFHTDAVGSVRMITDASGQVIGRYDYLPFGEPWPAEPTLPETRQFTGQERDATTGLDYFGARYYQSQTGRFTRPDDPGFMDPFNPQSTNHYAYAYHNPLRWVDPIGHYPCPPESEAMFCESNEPIDAGTRRFFWDSLFGNPFGILTSIVDRVTLSTPPMVTSGCTLQAPSGRFTVDPNAVALFQPSMTGAINSAFRNLNSQGIVPMITSGFRTARDQRRMQQGASGPNPAAAVSWHQVGLAVDLNSRESNFGTIRNAMTAEGLTWGGTFRRTDPVHFQSPAAGTSPTPAMISACGVR